MKAAKVDPRPAFLSSISTLVQAFSQLAAFRIVGNTALICIGSANTHEKQKCEASDITFVKELLKVNPREFGTFSQLFNESSVVLGCSWLEAFLGEVEEVLFLHDPKNLGDSIQVKLGKILSSSSIEELVHDLARRRVRERSQWGLASRISDLQQQYGFVIKTQESALQALSDVRNDVVHGRRPGIFEIKGRRVSYRPSQLKQAMAQDDAEKWLNVVFPLLAELYQNACKVLGVTGRFAQHRENMKFLGALTRGWARN